MASPKIPRLMMHPGSAASRGTRSPGIQRKAEVSDEDLAAKLSKKSRRSKSSESGPREPSVPKEPTTPRIRRRRPSKEDKSETSQVSQPSQSSTEKRWKFMTKNIDKMSREEIMSNFRMLMGDHMKLEKFLSFITRENETTRNQMETDLLDSMMYIEELKQALEVRMTRRTRVDPREAEERRSLIRQNKKLLKQLYESAKKIEKLEATIKEEKEQIELMEFQILESENSVQQGDEEKKIAENGNARSSSKTPERDARTPTAEPPSIPDARTRQLEERIAQLEAENRELREQISLEDENSLAESDKTIRATVDGLKTILREKENIQSELEVQVESTQLRCVRLEEILRRHGLADEVNSSSAPVSVANSFVGATGGAGVCSSFIDSCLSTAESGFDSETETTFSDHAPTPRRHRTPDRQSSCAMGDRRPSGADRRPSGADRRLSGASQPPNPDDTEDEEQSEGLNETGAINSLLSRSLFPLAAMVPLENKEIIREKVPDQMKAKEADGLLQATVRNFQKLLNDKEEEIEALKAKLSDIEKERAQQAESHGAEKLQAKQENEKPISEEKVKNLYSKVDRLERENERWRALVDRMSRTNGDATAGGGTGTLMATEEALRASQSRERALKGQLEATVQELKTLTLQQQHQLGEAKDLNDRNARYYSMQLQEVSHQQQLEEVLARLSHSDKRRQEADARVKSLSDEMTERRRAMESLENALMTSRKMESTLKRRLEAAEARQGGGRGPDGSPAKMSQLEDKVTQLESINSSLAETLKADRTRLHEATLRLSEMEAETRGVNDRLSEVQSREICAQKKILRLQAIYEDMLREYAEVKNNDVSWRKRSKGYSDMEGNLQEKVEKYETAMKVLQREKTRLDSQLCQMKDENKALRETMEVLTKKASEHESSYQEMRHLVETYQAKLAETSEQMVSSRRHPTGTPEVQRRRGSSNVGTPEIVRRGETRDITPEIRKGEGYTPADKRYLEHKLAEAEAGERRHQARVVLLEDSERQMQTKLLHLEAQLAAVNQN